MVSALGKVRAYLFPNFLNPQNEIIHENAFASLHQEFATVITTETLINTLS